MNLSIQDPNWPDSVYLLEAILEASENASSGAGVYAFASVGGVKLLLRDRIFERFLSRARFELIIGVDAVTNGATLDLLDAIAADYPRLSVRVFLNAEGGGLFHPKISWFRQGQSTQCLIGSGNLTVGGLRGNCEAFAAMVLSGSGHRDFRVTWASWLAFNRIRLLPSNDPDVRVRANRNTGIETPDGRRRDQNEDLIVEDPEGNISVSPGHKETDPVLIAEIPKSGDRWNQANFDLDSFENFFGALPGNTQRFILNHIDGDGHLGAEEIRPSVSVRSQNYRFELDAASGLPYPRRGRPIAVFLRTATRTFRYHLLLPGSREYDRVRNYLHEHSPRVGNRVFRLPTTVADLIRNDFSPTTLNLLSSDVEL